MECWITKVLLPKVLHHFFICSVNYIGRNIQQRLKAVLVFWKIKNPLRIKSFTDVASKDPRIDFEALKRIYSVSYPQLLRNKIRLGIHYIRNMLKTKLF